MTRCLLLVDGTNALMRRAAAVPTMDPSAVAEDVLPRLQRAARDLKATHGIVAMDSATSVRATTFAQYKFHRTVSSQPYVLAGTRCWSAAGWYVVQARGWEADDVIATLATRARGAVVTLSSDNDLLMLVSDRIRCAQYAPKGERPWLRILGPAEVQAKYGVPAAQLLDLKALVGEPGDNVPGVAGIGKVRAAKLLTRYGSIEDAILAGALPHIDQQQQARLSRALIELRTNLELPPIPPTACRIPLEQRA